MTDSLFTLTTCLERWGVTPRDLTMPWFFTQKPSKDSSLLVNPNPHLSVSLHLNLYFNWSLKQYLQLHPPQRGMRSEDERTREVFAHNSPSTVLVIKERHPLNFSSHIPTHYFSSQTLSNSKHPHWPCFPLSRFKIRYQGQQVAQWNATYDEYLMLSDHKSETWVRYEQKGMWRSRTCPRKQRLGLKCIPYRQATQTVWLDLKGEAAWTWSRGKTGSLI